MPKFPHKNCNKFFWYFQLEQISQKTSLNYVRLKLDINIYIN